LMRSAIGVAAWREFTTNVSTPIKPAGDPR
jgi:hypothetical protein